MSPVYHNYSESDAWVSPSPKQLEKERRERAKKAKCAKRDSIIGLVILVIGLLLVLLERFFGILTTFFSAMFTIRKVLEFWAAKREVEKDNAPKCGLCSRILPLDGRCECMKSVGELRREREAKEAKARRQEMIPRVIAGIALAVLILLAILMKPA